jgi:hypothetical protein
MADLLNKRCGFRDCTNVYDKVGPFFITMSDEWVEHGR